MRLPKKKLIKTEQSVETVVQRRGWRQRFRYRLMVKRYIRKVEGGVVKAVKDGCTYIDNTEFDYQLVAYRFITMKYGLIFAKNRFGEIYNIVLWK